MCYCQTLLKISLPQRNSMISNETNQTVEVSGLKYKIHQLAGKYRRCVFNTEEIPSDIYIPLDHYQISIAIRDMKACKRVVPKEEYIEKRIDPNELQGIYNVFNLLVQCHQSLQLRESVFYHAVDLMHRLLQNITIYNNTQIPRVLCALLFIVQKYEPTNDRMMSVRTIIKKLFGEQTSVQAQDIIDQELFILDSLEYRLQTVSPYSLIQFFFQCQRFNKAQMFLGTYLCSMVCIDQSHYRYGEIQLACAICLVICTKHNVTYSESLVYWSGVLAEELTEEYNYVLSVWRRHYERQLEGQPSAITKRYLHIGQCQVALIEPIM